MVHRDELTTCIYQILGSELLDKAAAFDTAPNSIQIKGREEVHKVVLGVSCSLEFIEQAIVEKADYLIVHHGLSLDHLVKNGRFDLVQDRLRLLFTQNLTLAGFHYSLDAHPTLGNNAQIIEKLGAKRLEIPYFDTWGWVGEFDKTINVHDFAQKTSELMQHDIFTVYAGPEKIKRIGVCSGGGRPHVNEMFEILDKKIDLHLTGEISESAPYAAEEGGYNYFSCGHYATEVFGVQALAKKLKIHYGDALEVEFIDIPSVL